MQSSLKNGYLINVDVNVNTNDNETLPFYRYPSPVPCGSTECDFGATCSETGGGADNKRCVCEINCRSPMYFREVSELV